jgi:hypothetical protein
VDADSIGKVAPDGTLLVPWAEVQADTPLADLIDALARAAVLHRVVVSVNVSFVPDRPDVPDGP